MLACSAVYIFVAGPPELTIVSVSTRRAPTPVSHVTSLLLAIVKSRAGATPEVSATVVPASSANSYKATKPAVTRGVPDPVTVMVTVSVPVYSVSSAVSSNTYSPATVKLAVVVRAVASVKLLPPDGPLCCVQRVVADTGSPSSVTSVPVKVAPSGHVIVWSEPASTVGAWLAGPTVSTPGLLVTLSTLLLTTQRKVVPSSASVVAGVVYDAFVAPAISLPSFCH